ncbi:MAG: hypothetical protein KAT79_01090, partial [candidate division Zixibacteria bacterium]|nr:hypothetical protein [candidate division Zixibacteria bacterium]
MVLYPARMKRVTLITHSDYIFQLTQGLHRSGIMQIDPLDMEELERRLPDRARLEGLSHRLDGIMDAIRYEEPVGIKEYILHPKPPDIFEIPERTEEEIISRAESILPEIEKEVESSQGKLRALKERESRLEGLYDEIGALRGMDFDLSLLGKGRYSYIIAGTTRDLLGLQEALDSKLIHISSYGSKGEYSIVI